MSIAELEMECYIAPPIDFTFPVSSVIWVQAKVQVQITDGSKCFEGVVTAHFVFLGIYCHPKGNNMS